MQSKQQSLCKFREMIELGLGIQPHAGDSPYKCTFLLASPSHFENIRCFGRPAGEILTNSACADLPEHCVPGAY